MTGSDRRYIVREPGAGWVATNKVTAEGAKAANWDVVDLDAQTAYLEHVLRESHHGLCALDCEPSPQRCEVCIVHGGMLNLVQAAQAVVGDRHMISPAIRGLAAVLAELGS